MDSSVRLDKWLWAARFFKTRSVARDAVSGGKVHLKDLDGSLARQVRSGELTFHQAVIDGLFVPLGAGSVDIGVFIEMLESQRYQGWYVIEQDTVLAAEPELGEGPIIAARQSFAFLEGVADGL